MSFSLEGCGFDVAEITNNFCCAVPTSTGTVVDYAAAWGGLFMAASQVSPIFQRFALATILSIGAFFVGNLTPPIFHTIFSDNEPLFHDSWGTLVVAFFCVGGFLKVLNKSITFKKSADLAGGFRARTRNRPLDRRVGERTTGGTQPQADSVNLSEFSQDAVVVTNAEGVVLELNRQAQTMFGWSLEQMAGQSIEALIPHCELAHPQGLDNSLGNYSAVRNLPIERQKLFGVRKNGTTFAVEVSLSLGRSAGSYAIAASIRAAEEPEQTHIELQLREFTRGHTVSITERNQADHRSHALYASLELRLVALVNNPVRLVDVSEGGSPRRRFNTQANPPFEVLENRFTDSSDDLADDKWAARWACEEKKARTSAFALLRVIDDIKKSLAPDGSSLELAVPYRMNTYPSAAGSCSGHGS